MKICTKCNIEKELTNFGNSKDYADGLKKQCKQCASAYNKAYQISYYQDNKEELKEDARDYYNNNSESINKKRRKYTDEQKEELKRTVNDRRRIYENTYRKERKKRDPLFKLLVDTRSLINSSFKRTGFTKSMSSEKLIGCSLIYFREYLEGMFEDWMTWDNKGNPKDGILEPNKSWDIDHIIPISSAKTEEELIELNHYTNLQPLCSYENRIIKRDNIKNI
jgi:hypothetical protein